MAAVVPLEQPGVKCTCLNAHLIKTQCTAALFPNVHFYTELDMQPSGYTDWTTNCPLNSVHFLPLSLL